jgi:hypothetical protein
MIGLVALFLLVRDVGERQTALFALLIAAVNPQDIYFAREARMYAQAAALCTLGAWCLWRWIVAAAARDRPATWWPWMAGYTLCAAAAIHTHYLCALIFLAQGAFAIPWFARRRQMRSLVGYVVAALAVAVAFVPWFCLVRQFRETLYNPWLGWIDSPKATDFFSFLGGEFFWGQTWAAYPNRWMATIGLPVAILLFGAWRVWRSPRGGESVHSRRVRFGFLAWLLFGPVVLMAVAVVVYHPIFWRPRFSMLVLPPFLALIAFACSSLSTRTRQWLAVAPLVLVMAAGTWTQRQVYHTPNWRLFVRIWKAKGPPARVVFLPITFQFCASRYLSKRVLSAPEAEIKASLPSLQGAEIWIVTHEANPDAESSLRNWLLSLGRPRRIYPPGDICVLAVEVGEPSLQEQYSRSFDRWYEPKGAYRSVEGFDKRSGFHIFEYEPTTQLMFRWSTGKAWFGLYHSEEVSTVVLNCALPPPAIEGYRPELKIYIARSKRRADLFRSKPVVEIGDWRAADFLVDLPAPPGSEPLWVGWTVNPMNLEEAGASADPRDLGLRVNWLAVACRRD